VGCAYEACIPRATSAFVGGVEGTETGTTTLNRVTLASVSDGIDHLSHLGTLTAHSLLQFTITGGNTDSFTGTETDAARNGDKLFSTFTGSGTFTPTTAESTEVNTITGGTGRFAEARGTFTYTISSVVISTTATSESTRDTPLWKDTSASRRDRTGRGLLSQRQDTFWAELES
jgi:hypothetical protein